MTKEQAVKAIEKFVSNAKKVQAEHYATHNGKNHFIKLVHIIDDEFIHLLFSHFHNDVNVNDDVASAIKKSYSGLTPDEQNLIRIIRAIQEKHVDYEKLLLSKPNLMSYELFESVPLLYKV